MNEALARAAAEGKPECDHSVYFDEKQARGLPVHVVKQRWPRLDGRCPKGCGYVGIYYASFLHYIMGDW